MKSRWDYIKKNLKHKYHVFKTCYQCGISFQGITHDLSKFSPSEFFNYVKVDSENPSFNLEYDLSHDLHKRKNKHHPEYWMEEFGDEIVPTKIPIKYCIELICDKVGTMKSYNKEWNRNELFENWIKEDTRNRYHIETINLLSEMYNYISFYGWNQFCRVMRKNKNKIKNNIYLTLHDFDF